MAFVAVVAASVTGAALMAFYQSYRTVTVCIMPYCCATNDVIVCCSWYGISFLLLLLLSLCYWNVFVVAAAAVCPSVS